MTAPSLGSLLTPSAGVHQRGGLPGDFSPCAPIPIRACVALLATKVLKLRLVQIPPARIPSQETFRGINIPHDTLADPALMVLFVIRLHCFRSAAT